jgi:glycosyltransferase involved in cell wall biosynthesis
MKKRISIIGIQGLPNNYGGFETLADYLTKYLNEEYEFTIFCSSVNYNVKLNKYNNANLYYLPFSANGFSSIVYDSISLLFSLRHDKILILGASSGIFMAFLRPWKDKFILNIGGIDWKRSKWSYVAQKAIKVLEFLAVKNTGILVSDNQAMSEYFLNFYSKNSVLIEYGGDQAKFVQCFNEDFVKYPFLNVKYFFSVARIQPDNNIDLILDSFAIYNDIPLVFVGNWNSSSYGRNLKVKYSNVGNVFLLDAIYDHRELNLVRSNCYGYIHGHSAGGTNPALVEAMNLGLPILAFSSDFNIYTTEGKALYFKNSEELILLFNNLSLETMNLLKISMLEISKRRYLWEIISKKYSEIINL